MMKLNRTFNLKDSKNTVYTLTFLGSPLSGFFYDVTGLGYERSVEYLKVNDTYNLIKDDINQGKIAGSILFYGKYAYQEYLKFAHFCQDKSLSMYYRTPAGEYYRDGMVSKIEKSEQGGALKVRVEFEATTLWYREVSVEVTSPSSPYEVVIQSDSAIDCPCHLSAWGMTISNGDLIWTHSVLGKYDYYYQIANGKLTGLTLTSSEVFHVRTDTNPYEIYKMWGGSKTSLYAKSDFSTPRFTFLKKGANKFSVSVAPTSLKIESRLLYETV